MAGFLVVAAHQVYIYFLILLESQSVHVCLHFYVASHVERTTTRAEGKFTTRCDCSQRMAVNLFGVYNSSYGFVKFNIVSVMTIKPCVGRSFN